MADFELIAAHELDISMKNTLVFLIDLRSPQEYRSHHIPGAVNIPYEKLKNCHGLPREMTLVLYCERGSVSMVAARGLAAKGYRVKTLIGGIHGYENRHND